jgi:hypothetical protein
VSQITASVGTGFENPTKILPLPIRRYSFYAADVRDGVVGCFSDYFPRFIHSMIITAYGMKTNCCVVSIRAAERALFDGATA